MKCALSLKKMLSIINSIEIDFYTHMTYDLISFEFFSHLFIHIKALEVRADLDNDSDAKHLIDLIIDSFGRIDVLVNNAAQFDCSSNIESTDSLQVFDKVCR